MEDEGELRPVTARLLEFLAQPADNIAIFTPTGGTRSTRKSYDHDRL